MEKSVATILTEARDTQKGNSLMRSLICISMAVSLFAASGCALGSIEPVDQNPGPTPASTGEKIPYSDTAPDPWAALPPQQDNINPPQDPAPEPSADPNTARPRLPTLTPHCLRGTPGC